MSLQTKKTKTIDILKNLLYPFSRLSVELLKSKGIFLSIGDLANHWSLYSTAHIPMVTVTRVHSNITEWISKHYARINSPLDHGKTQTGRISRLDIISSKPCQSMGVKLWMFLPHVTGYCVCSFIHQQIFLGDFSNKWIWSRFTGVNAWCSRRRWNSVYNAGC